MPTGTSMVRELREPPTAPTGASGVALYARISFAEQQDDAMRQLQRLHDGVVEDFVVDITSMTARISGRRYDRRTSKRWAERLRTCIEHILHREGEEA